MLLLLLPVFYDNDDRCGVCLLAPLVVIRLLVIRIYTALLNLIVYQRMLVSIMLVGQLVRHLCGHASRNSEVDHFSEDIETIRTLLKTIIDNC